MKISQIKSSQYVMYIGHKNKNHKLMYILAKILSDKIPSIQVNDRALYCIMCVHTHDAEKYRDIRPSNFYSL